MLSNIVYAVGTIIMPVTVWNIVMTITVTRITMSIVMAHIIMPIGMRIIPMRHVTVSVLMSDVIIPIVMSYVLMRRVAMRPVSVRVRVCIGMRSPDAIHVSYVSMGLKLVLIDGNPTKEISLNPR